MKRRLLKEGDRIRLKSKLISGWKGYGTVKLDQIHHDGVVYFRKDGNGPVDWLHSHSMACSHDVVLLRNQAPPVEAT